jgi:hypothetical protein
MAVEYPGGGVFGGQDFGVLYAYFKGVVVGDAGGLFVDPGAGAVGGGCNGTLAEISLHHFGVKVIDRH